MAQQRYPVDEITRWTPYELQTTIKNLTFTIAYSIAMPTKPGDMCHGQEIPAGYTEVGVEQVSNDWKTLELNIHGGTGKGH